MPVPTLVTDLSTTLASNSPAGSDNVFPSLDDYLRSLSGFIASIRDNSGNGWVSPYLPLTYSAGTANGVVYLNGSKVVTTGSALVFDGTNLSTTGTATATKLIPTGGSATGNGMYLPAANTLAWSNNGAETMRLDSSGNLGLGVTPSAWGTGSSVKAVQLPGASLWGFAGTNAYLSANAYYNGTNRVYVTSSFASEYSQASGVHAWFTAPSGTAGNAITFTQAMTLDADGELGIGTTSPSYPLHINKAFSVYGVYLNNASTSTGDYSVFVATGASSGMPLMMLGAGGTTVGNAGVQGAGYVGTQNNTPLVFVTNDAARARITSGGDLLVGTTSNTGYGGSVISKSAADTNPLAVLNPSATNPYGIAIGFTGAAPNDATRTFLSCADNAATRATIRSNGGIANYQGNDVNLSDRREKTNFAPAKSYLDTICAIPVQTFNYIDQSEDDPGLTLGVVAQDVQAVAPELVMESNWGTEDNPKMRLSIYQTDLQYALMKCVQELKAQNDELRARVAALEAA